jgi:hypothetical protein
LVSVAVTGRIGGWYAVGRSSPVNESFPAPPTSVSALAPATSVLPASPPLRKLALLADSRVSAYSGMPNPAPATTVSAAPFAPRYRISVTAAFPASGLFDPGPNADTVPSKLTDAAPPVPPASLT